MRTVISTIVAAGALTLGAALPAAAQTADSLRSGDDRATAHPGNATTCAHAGLRGSLIPLAPADFAIDESGRYLDILNVPDGYRVTGTVVKGGPAYNVYPADVRTRLQSPLLANGNVPQISHWYVCGKRKKTTTETTTPTDTGTPTSTPTETGTPTPTETGTPTGTPTPTTTAPGDGGKGDELAATGAATRGLLLGGIGLLTLGAALVFAVRRGRLNLTD